MFTLTKTGSEHIENSDTNYVGFYSNFYISGWRSIFNKVTHTQPIIHDSDYDNVKLNITYVIEHRHNFVNFKKRNK